jgi:hypothetical protein
MSFRTRKKVIGKLSWFPFIWWKIVNVMTFNNIEAHNMPSYENYRGFLDFHKYNEQNR